MKSDVPLDYAVFQLSPRRSQCELFVSYDGTTEKLASGLAKLFVTHLKVADEQLALSAKTIKLEVEGQNISDTWFTKGTLQRFVQFVNSPEILELVNTLDAEMSQLEAARKIYSQGSGAGGSGGDGMGAMAASDSTKKELLRAIDVRLRAIREDLSIACNHASAAGFNPVTISELQLFADHFGSCHLHDVCSKFINLYQKRPEVFSTHKSRVKDQHLQSSSGSDMSLDDVSNNMQINSLLTPQLAQPEEANSPIFQPSVKPSLPFHFRRSSRELSVEKDDIQDSGNKINEKKDETSSEMTESDSRATKPQLTRRLSVQERISMFENKQKEQSSSGGKPTVPVGKSAELIRLSSDLSSAGALGSEKAVLRRWSGVSDMSIDVSGERKEVNGNATTPTAFASMKPGSSSSLVSEGKGNRRDSADNSSLLKPETGTFASQVADDGVKKQTDTEKDEVEAKSGEVKFEAQVAPSFSATDSSDSIFTSVSSPRRSEIAQPQNQSSGMEHPSKLSFGKAKDLDMTNSISSPAFHNNIERFDSSGLVGELGNSATPAGEDLVSGSQFKVDKSATGKGHAVQKVQLHVSDSNAAYDSSKVNAYQAAKSEIGVVGLRNEHNPGSNSRTSQWASVDMPFESASSTISSQHISQNKNREPEEVVAHFRGRSVGREADEINEKEQESAQRLTERSSVDIEDLRTTHRMKFQKHGSVADQSRRSSVRDDSGSGSGNIFSGRSLFASQETFPSSMMPSDQAERPRLPKGNQEHNDELKMKANELEKLFVEHKLRLPIDQSSTVGRNKSIETQVQETNFLLRSSSAEVYTLQGSTMKVVAKQLSSSSNMKFNVSPVNQQLGSEDYDVTTPKQSIYSLTLSDESRGKLYDKYMQKRDAKLKEEWSLYKGEKEARMKALHDCLERSTVELKSQFTGSVDRQLMGHRAEKFKSFNTRSAIRREQPIHSFVSDGDEDGLNSDEYLADGASKSVQTKRVFLNSNATSVIPRSSATPLPQSSVKFQASTAGRRKSQAENPLAQSVPNFSDFRKENTKPSSAVSKVGGRSQARSYHRSKSSSEDVLALKDEKARRPQHLRKSSASPLELNDLPFHTYDLVRDKSNDELADADDESPKNLEGRSFIREGNNGVHLISGSGIPRSEVPYSAQMLGNGNGNLMSVAKNDEYFEAVADEDFATTEIGKMRMNQESADSGFENGDSLTLLSRVKPSKAESPASLPSAFRAMGSLNDFPGESPGSWNSRMHNPFSFPHETSDFDTSVDSPTGNPAYWNQIDPEGARMRKKWGAAQKSLVSDSSHGQSRRDVTKGLKRFLKFGWKNRGADSLVDWVSVTTSEGDDDTEDGRDPAYGSSEDLRKSRMGFSHYHASDDGFSETDSFNEQVHGLATSIPVPPINCKLREDHLSGSALKAPRSFFSLSTFRSKGSDAKPR